MPMWHSTCTALLGVYWFACLGSACAPRNACWFIVCKGGLMNFATRCAVIAFAALVVLFCGTSARADSVTFDLNYQGNFVGDTISGSLVLNATSDGGGVYTVNSVSGTQVLNGILENVNNVIPSTSTPFTDSGQFDYDELIAPGQSPSIDFYGLLFDVSIGGVEQAYPVNICSNCDDNNSTTYSEYAYLPNGGGNSTTFGSTFEDYSITSLSLVQVPEPSTLLLLGFGLAALFFVARRKQFAGLQI